MALLTTQWHPNDPTGAVNAYLAGAKIIQAQEEMGIRQQEVAAKMQAAKVAQEQDMALRLLQEDRLRRANELQNEFNQAREQRLDTAAKAKLAQYQSENSPFPDLSMSGGVVGSTSAGPEVTEGVDLFSAGNPVSPAEGILNLNATGYHPYDVKNAKEDKMEGGTVDTKGNPIRTLEAFQRGEAPYVTVAVPQGSPLYGKTLASPQMPGVVFKADDHFGTLGGKKVAGPKIDIAVDNRDMASKLTRPMQFTIADNLPPASATKQIPAGEQPSIPASDPASSIAGIDPETQQFYRSIAGLPKKVAQQAIKERAVRMATRAGGSVNQTVDELVQREGLTYDAETGRYRNSQGAAFFVDKGVNGKLAVKQVRPDDKQTGKVLKDNVGNIYRINPDDTHTLIVEAKAKPSAKAEEAFIDELDMTESAAKEYRSATNDKNFFGLGGGKKDAAMQKWVDQHKRLKRMQETFPSLKIPADLVPPTEVKPAEKPKAEEPEKTLTPEQSKVYADEEEALSAGHKKGDIVMVTHPKTGKPVRAQLE